MAQPSKKPGTAKAMLGNTNAVKSGDSSPILVTRLAHDLKVQYGTVYFPEPDEGKPIHTLQGMWMDLLWEKVAQYRQARRHCQRHGGDYRKDGSVRPAAVRGDKHWNAILSLLDKIASHASTPPRGLAEQVIEGNGHNENTD